MNERFFKEWVSLHDFLINPVRLSAGQFDLRGSTVIDTIVVHAMGEFVRGRRSVAYATQFLDAVGLSAHYFITPSGMVLQCGGIGLAGRHARGHNQRSIGIELLVPGAHDLASLKEALRTEWWSYEQQKALRRLLVILGFCPVRPESYSPETGPLDPSIWRVVGHSEIDGRKPDPGPRFGVVLTEMVEEIRAGEFQLAGPSRLRNAWAQYSAASKGGDDE